MTLSEQREAEIEALRAEIKADEPIFSPEEGDGKPKGMRPMGWIVLIIVICAIAWILYP